MRFHSIAHTYKVIPPVLGNDKSDEPVIIGLTVVPATELDAAVLEQANLTPDMRSKKAFEQIEKHVKSIEGLYVDDEEIKTFRDLYEKGPRELYSWICGAVYSTQSLRDNEVKN